MRTCDWDAIVKGGLYVAEFEDLSWLVFRPADTKHGRPGWETDTPENALRRAEHGMNDADLECIDEGR